jgi:hypothetical protein
MKTKTDQILESFTESCKEKGIFARIPSHLHRQVLEIKARTDKSIYEIVEASLRLFVDEYWDRVNKQEEGRDNGKT